MMARNPYVHTMLARMKIAILATLGLASLALSAPLAQAGGSVAVVASSRPAHRGTRTR